MKYGSFVNMSLDAMNTLPECPAPAVGMGCTILMWSDRHAATINEVLDGGKLIVITEDRATRTDQNGMSESQAYSFERNPDGCPLTYKRDRNGAYRRASFNPDTKRWCFTSEQTLLLGLRDKYYDFSM